MISVRVLLVNKFVHVTGGADIHCRGLATILAERGHEVAFLSTATDHEHEFLGAFVPATVTHGSRDGLAGSQQAVAAANALWNPTAAAAMRRLVDDFRPDVVHAHKLYPQLSVAPVVVASRSRIPVVQTLHDFELMSASSLDERGGWVDHDESRVTYRLLNTCTRPVRRLVHAPRAAAFVSVSRYVASVYRAHRIASEVLPNFLPSGPDEPEVPSFAEREGIAFIGRLQPEKGVQDVVALAERLPNIRVTIVGSGELGGWVSDQAGRLSNLEATGFLDGHEIAAVMRRVRVVVAPSRWQEPGPLTAIEAMAQGTPIVAYAVGGLAEYVSDAGAGRVVPSDVDSLVQACRDLVGSAEVWSQMSRQAVDAVRTTHSRATYADRIERVYDSVMTASR